MSKVLKERFPNKNFSKQNRTCQLKDCLSPQPETFETLEFIKQRPLKNTNVSLSPYAAKNSISLKSFESCKQKEILKRYKSRDQGQIYFLKPSRILSPCSPLNVVNLTLNDAIRQDNEGWDQEYFKLLINSIETSHSKHKKLEICDSVIDKLIEKEIKYKDILYFVKKIYDDTINTQACEINKLKGKLNKTIASQSHVTLEYNKIDAQLKSLLSEHEKLGKAFDDVKKNACQSALDLEKNKENVENIIKKNLELEEALIDTKSKLKHYKIKSKNLLELINVCQDKGFPIHDIIKNLTLSSTQKPDYNSYEDEFSYNAKDYNSIFNESIVYKKNRFNSLIS